MKRKMYFLVWLQKCKKNVKYHKISNSLILNVLICFEIDHIQLGHVCLRSF